MCQTSDVIIYLVLRECGIGAPVEGPIARHDLFHAGPHPRLVHHLGEESGVLPLGDLLLQVLQIYHRQFHIVVVHVLPEVHHPLVLRPHLKAVLQIGHQRPPLETVVHLRYGRHIVIQDASGEDFPERLVVPQFGPVLGIGFLPGDVEAVGFGPGDLRVVDRILDAVQYVHPVLYIARYVRWVPGLSVHGSIQCAYGIHLRVEYPLVVNVVYQDTVFGEGAEP